MSDKNQPKQPGSKTTDRSELVNKVTAILADRWEFEKVGNEFVGRRKEGDDLGPAECRAKSARGLAVKAMLKDLEDIDAMNGDS